MTQVIKRGGKRRQEFSPSKIRDAIRKTAKEAGFSPSKVEETVKEVGKGVIDFFGKKKVVKSVDIRRSVLGRLGRKAKLLASKWKSFEKRKSGRF